jgi:3',5'-nucleoside bisphosphate phosphatase
MKTLRAELHVHTVLSPCAEVEMIPPLIIAAAQEMGIAVLGITDHNASANAAALIEAAQGSGITVLPGMELQTQEEVHLLCLFDSLEQLQAWQAVVDAALPDLQNRPEFFGEQFVVDATGDFVRREERLLLTSCSLTLEEACQQAAALGGLVIPAHVNRKAYGLIQTLGFIPSDLAADGLEISRHLSPTKACQTLPQLAGYPLVQNGDAHRLDELMGVNEFTVEAANVAELRLALQGLQGRRLVIKQN